MKSGAAEPERRRKVEAVAVASSDQRNLFDCQMKPRCGARWGLCGDGLLTDVQGGLA